MADLWRCEDPDGMNLKVSEIVWITVGCVVFVVLVVVVVIVAVRCAKRRSRVQAQGQEMNPVK